MRVLFATHSFPRFQGDAPGSFLLRLAGALGANGTAVTAIAPAAKGLAADETIGGIRVRRFRYAPRKYETLAYHGGMAEDVARSWTALGAMGALVVAEIAAIRSAIAEIKPDVVHAHWWFPSGLAASLATIGTGVPLVTTCHGSDVRLLATRPAAAPLAARVFRASASVTVVSSWLGELTERLTACTPIVAPMPVEIDSFAPVPHSSSDSVLFVGRLNEQKGAAHAIRAIARTARVVRLCMVGDGPRRAELESLARSLGVADRIEWRASVAQPQLASLMSHADLLLMPAVDEGLGLVAVESILSGTPVVGFASGGLTDVVRDGAGGVLVPTGEIDALARAMDSLLADPAERTSAADRGRARALATFSPAAVAARYAAIYKDSVAPYAR